MLKISYLRELFSLSQPERVESKESRQLLNDYSRWLPDHFENHKSFSSWCFEYNAKSTWAPAKSYFLWFTIFNFWLFLTQIGHLKKASLHAEPVVKRPDSDFSLLFSKHWTKYTFSPTFFCILRMYAASTI